jgi:Asp-tRNA(Asn)/Glu-tRNA(Gln) amidotransferase A subunit family amidase
MCHFGGLFLTIGEVDGVVKASPACQRAVLEAVDAMRKQGHECVEIVPPDGKCVWPRHVPSAHKFCPLSDRVAANLQRSGFVGWV